MSGTGRFITPVPILLQAGRERRHEAGREYTSNASFASLRHDAPGGQRWECRAGGVQPTAASLVSIRNVSVSSR
jgi:hypothetical protein